MKTLSKKARLWCTKSYEGRKRSEIRARRRPHYSRSHFRHHRGDVEAGFRAADCVYEDTFYFPSAQHYPMEPHVCVAQFEGESLTVWPATQSPFPVRQELARVFGVPFSGVRVIVPYVGGGYALASDAYGLTALRAIA